MQKEISIQLKAAFLLVIFGLNTLVGFACAIGVDMGFNSHHHDEEATEISIHDHADGKKHHHHDEAEEHHDKKDGSKKDDCCNNKVVKISQADKAIVQSSTIIKQIFFTAFTSSLWNINISYPSQVTGSARYFTRNYHPPIPDIRITIQSFQI